MMTTAMDRFKELKDDTASLFFLPNQSRMGIGSRLYLDFSWFVKYSLPQLLSDLSEDLLTLETTSQNLPGWFLTAHLNQYGLEADKNFACSDCFPAHSRSRAGEMESSRDFCGELLLLQHRILLHRFHDDEDEAEDETSWRSHVHLSHEVRERASEIFASCGLREGAEWAKSFGVYHPDVLTCYLPGPTENFSDCLERSWLHMRMDSVDNWDDVDSIVSSVDVSIVKDRRDILGRTALIIACREAWTETVRWLLEEEADPGLTTIYGSLPLHYAAAKGSIDICQLLLSHKTRFDIKAKDCAGKTALDYAREYERQDVVNLLSAEYVAAYLEDDELRRARSLQAGTESDGVQGSYFE